MVVKKMIKEAKKECKEDPPPLPLIRLRVEHTEFESFNTQRFGQQFVGKVANPKDILHFHRKRSSKSTAKPAVNTTGVRGSGPFLFLATFATTGSALLPCPTHTRCAGARVRGAARLPHPKRVAHGASRGAIVSNLGPRLTLFIYNPSFPAAG